MISRNPDEVPEFDPVALRSAAATGYRPILIRCDNPNEENEGVTFWSFAYFVPRIGETIILENDSQCRVEDVIFHIKTVDGVATMFPYVYALLFNEAY